MIRTFLLPCFLLPFTTLAQAEPKKEVLAVIDRFFSAMTSRDTAAMALTMVREGSLHVASLDGSKAARSVPHTDYLVMLAKGTERLVERYWDPAVRVDGTIASVTMPYDFHVDGKFSHCGIDLFTLVKGPDGWRIAGVAYTRQVENCPPSPLGSLKP